MDTTILLDEPGFTRQWAVPFSFIITGVSLRTGEQDKPNIPKQVHAGSRRFTPVHVSAQSSSYSTGCDTQHRGIKSERGAKDSCHPNCANSTRKWRRLLRLTMTCPCKYQLDIATWVDGTTNKSQKMPKRKKTSTTVQISPLTCRPQSKGMLGGV